MKGKGISKKPLISTNRITMNCSSLSISELRLTTGVRLRFLNITIGNPRLTEPENIPFLIVGLLSLRIRLRLNKVAFLR